MNVLISICLSLCLINSRAYLETNLYLGVALSGQTRADQNGTIKSNMKHIKSLLSRSSSLMFTEDKN
jgi:hypothetical protein